jgi:2-keto-4-pentenoate hydratase
MAAEEVERWADRLYRAERAQTSIPPLSDAYPWASVADGYAIQAGYARRRIDAGAQLVGRKIGATSEAIQRLFGVNQPDFGHLFDDMRIDDDGPVSSGQLVQPKVEGELAFILAETLAGPGVDRAMVLRATDHVLPCIEIIDSRIQDWRIRLVDTIADNGSSARFILGRPPIDPLVVDLASIEVRLLKNRSEVAAGRGDAVLGHPADAVAWLANAIAPFGASLPVGAIVLSGAFATAVDGAPGDRFVADFGAAGRASCHITS